MCAHVYTQLTFREHGSPGAQSSPVAIVPSLLSDDFCAVPLCRMTNLHNGECICSKGFQTDLEENSMSHYSSINIHFVFRIYSNKSERTNFWSVIKVIQMFLFLNAYFYCSIRKEISGAKNTKLLFILFPTVLFFQAKMSKWIERQMWCETETSKTLTSNSSHTRQCGVRLFQHDTNH